MSAQLSTRQIIDSKIIAALVLNGDLKGLRPEQKIEFYKYRCEQVGLDSATKPFDLLILNGKEVLYANAACSQQLTAIHKLSHEITGREKVDDIYIVNCRVIGIDKRYTENMGAVSLANLKGETLANAMMKANTKAIRRAVLAHCGLGMLDETEVATIVGAKVVPWNPITMVTGMTIENKSEDKITNDEYKSLIKALSNFPETATENFIEELSSYISDLGQLGSSNELSGWYREYFERFMVAIVDERKRVNICSAVNEHNKKVNGESNQ